MAPLSLKIVLDEGAVTRTVKFESSMRVDQAQAIVKEKILTADDGKEYGLFLTSADDDRSGIWLERHRNLDYYMLRDGDQLHYLCRLRNLRVRMLDGSVKTLPVDEAKTVELLMVDICARIGITNHDEYSLCHDGDEGQEEKLAPGTGTLTLRRVAQHKERDAKMEQLSKKLKTDDNVEWLDQHKTLREQRIDPKETLLLKRRLFYTDRNVDARDPVQLNLLYVQTRNAILEGRHPVTEEQAVVFAGIECQVHYGDFQEDKHKPGLIENLQEYLPEQYSSSRSVEKKILKEFKKHSGLSQLDAKHLYTKTARDLPTYGVTFFLVKEKQPGKKKLVPRLLGINAESILRLDEVTKEVLQVWPLTQVKTYHAGKSETFTLNFGDYSDKEYSVKTNDAHRIRDILQGYIDIIKRRLEGKHNLSSSEHYAICEDNVEMTRGHIMEHIKHSPNKIMEETFVGPSKIISYEPGQAISQGTQILTVQQIVVTNKGGSQQTVMMGEVPMRKDMSMDFVRKLNRLNSNSVKVVTMLTEPSESNVAEAQRLVETMRVDMPSIEEGVNAAAQKQGTEDAKKKLLDELRELRDCMKALTDATAVNVNPENGQEAARRIADLSTQMYFSLDPRTVKRQEFCRRSRSSFIQDDKIDATLRRASFIAAAQNACTAIDDARTGLHQEYQGPLLNATAVEELERAAADKMGKLNAAVALYLTAYSDPKNVDYSAAVTSMNNIHELLPELIKDAHILSAVKDGKSRQEFLDEMQALCDAAKRVCLITDPDDHEKIQEAANDYGRVSQKLLFTFKRRNYPEKQNEIIELAKDVGHKTTLLLVKANELTSVMPAGPAAADLDDAGVKCADAAQDLLACAQLTAPSIHEPHCQSALTASAENLSTRAQALAACWKPLVEEPSRKDLGEDLKSRTLDLAKALDRLKGAFASLNGTPEERTDEDQVKKGRRVQFITTVAAAKKGVDEAENELNKPPGGPVEGLSAEELRRRLAQRIAQLNAALAALVTATADRENPDYATADLAMGTITELMPEIVKDGKVLSASQDENERAAMLANLRELCSAARDVCASSERGVENLNKSAAKFAKTSGKLLFVFNPRRNQSKQNEIVELSSTACAAASQMLSGARQLSAGAGGQQELELDSAGVRVADSANALLTSAQLTAPCISDPRCQASLLSSVDNLSQSSRVLAALWAPLLQDPRFLTLTKKLEEDRRGMQEALDRLRKACQGAPSDGSSDARPGDSEKRCLQFITTAAAAQERLQAAENELNKPVVSPKKQVSSAELQQKLSAAMAQLHAAMAALVTAVSDPENPDYATADLAVSTIAELMPDIVKDGKTLSAGQDEKSRAQMLANLNALVNATRDICANSGQDVQKLNDSAAKFAKTSGKLVYVFNPRASQDKEHEIVALSSSACSKASKMLSDAYQLPPTPELDGAGAKVAEAAKMLFSSAQLTAPCISDPRCQAVMRSSVDGLSAASQQLAAVCAPLMQDPLHQALGKQLEEDRSDLQKELERLKNACLLAPGNVSADQISEAIEKRRLRFVASAASAQKQVQDAERELDKPVVAPKDKVSSAELQRKLSQALAQLNAAIAALVAATSDREKPDYEAADQAMNTINQLLPGLVKDTKSLSAASDESARAAMLADLRALCEAAREACAGAAQPTTEELNNAAAKFASASTKLVYVFNPRPNQDKEYEIIDLSSLACEKASQLLNGVYQLAAEAESEPGSEIDVSGSRVADAANALLTTAQLTAPCISEPSCQSCLLSSADTLSTATDHLAATWAPLLKDPRFKTRGLKLEEERIELQKEIEKLKDACRVAEGDFQVKHVDPELERGRLQFLSGAASAQDNMLRAEKELDKPMVPSRTVQSPSTLQSKLAHSLAQLRTAMAALLAATTDRDKPNYDEAERAAHAINLLLPQVVKDTKALSATRPEAERAAMLEEARAMCAVSRALDAAAREGRRQDAVKLANNAAKLFYVFNPQPKEHKITQLSSAACEKVSKMVANANQLAEKTPGSKSLLLTSGSRTADAAETLLATAQLTAPSIHEAESKAAMSSAVDSLHEAGAVLAAQAGEGLCGDFKGLAEALEAVREAVRADEDSVKSPTRRAAPPPPKRTVSQHITNEAGALALGHSLGTLRDANEEFLHRMRCEESQDANTATSAAETKAKRRTDDEKALHQEFVKTVDAASLKIKKAEEDINKVYRSVDEVIPLLTVDQTLVAQKQMEQKLALAAVAVADLVASNHPDAMDLTSAFKSTSALSDVMPHIVQDAKLLRGSLGESEREAFLADVLGLFDATKKLLDSAKDDRKKLDQSAVEFGNKSGKLLYVVSTDVDPSQEKEVLSRVRHINECASRVTVLGADAASSLDSRQMHDLCGAGGKCAEAATTLAYTAKLVAPSIQNSESHEALTKASTNLTDSLQAYSLTWKPLETSQPSTAQELKTEAAGLEDLLEELRKDLSSGKLVKRRAVDRVVVEDTPLRILACVVLEEAKRRAESTSTPADLRSKFAKYANALSQAIRQLDLANHKCRQAPRNMEKRQELEYAVQDLQVTLLQTRPSQDDKPQNYIVDLTEYVQDISNDVEQLKKECKNGQNELQAIKQHCDTISSQAEQVMSPGDQLEKTADGSDHIQDVEQFAEECDKRVNAINAIIEELKDGKLKIDLQEKATRLSEDCNMLRFATKSALATSQSVSLDATLEDLTDLETRIDEMLVPGEKKTNNKRYLSGVGLGRLVAAASRACAGVAGDLPSAFTAYMDDVRAGTDADDEADRNRSKAHLKKVLELLRALTMTTSRHVATWQKLGHPETAEITGQILEELDSHQNHVNAASGKAQSTALSGVDMNKLLFPTEVKIQGDHKQVSSKLEHAAAKLSLSSSTLLQSAHKPEALTRSAHAAVDAAVSVAALAGALRTGDLAQSQKIDEATKEMSLQTYNALRAADVVSQDPDNYASRRKLLDACRLLNDAINKLLRTTTPGDKMQRECRELTRSLQLQQSLLQSALQPACAAPYKDCVDALHNQSDVIQKLSNDEPMSREEFTKTLSYVSSAVANSTEYAAQCAYLISIAEQNKDIALEGLVDTSRIQNLSEAVQDTCHRIIRTDVEQAQAEEVVLTKQVEDLQQAIAEAKEKGAGKVGGELAAAGAQVDAAAKALYAVVNERTPDRAKITTRTIRLVDAAKAVDAAAENISRVPQAKGVSQDTMAKCDDILKHSRNLGNNMLSLIREVKASDDDMDPMTWVTFGTSRKTVLDMFEALLNSVRVNGKQAGVIDPSQSDLEEEDMPKKSYVQVQLDLANKWLKRPTSKADTKAAGEQAARNLIILGEKMAEDLKDTEQEEMLHLIVECKALLADCYKKYEQDKASVLMERLKELKKGIERGVVSRVVEDFLEGEEPLADLDILADAEKDEAKRKFLLERKIAELLAHLGRVTRTARIVADAGSGGPQVTEDLIKCSDQTELLAPMLVQAAQQRVTSPDDKAAIEHYQKLLAQYAESLASVRSLCDQAVDPMDFVQTASETMQRMREEKNHQNDPQKCAYASTAITKLANRVINVSLSANDVRRDPELQRYLKEARERLKATVPAPNARPSRVPDWKDTTAEILRTTGEVESVLGGEMIFKKQQGSDQPIFAAALDLHTAIREWSAKDNDIVAVAKRMAVLMAKLSDYMNTDRKRELLATSKAIVSESHEVADLARKLAHECSDVRIKTNLLQVCDRIPTISGQLKMLTTVKGSSLGQQGFKEDQEDMITLIGNAQNLMMSVQEVVKAAASASVKIASQRGGPRMRWVRKNYY